MLVYTKLSPYRPEPKTNKHKLILGIKVRLHKQFVVARVTQNRNVFGTVMHAKLKDHKKSTPHDRMRTQTTERPNELMFK